MSRPKRYNDARVATAIRLPSEMHDRLLVAAEERDVSANWLVTRAIGEFLDRLLPIDEIVLTRRTGEDA